MRVSIQQHNLCFYRNKVKSMASPENPRGMDWCDFEQGYVPHGQRCSAGDYTDEFIQIDCKNCGRHLVRFKLAEGKDIKDMLKNQQLMIVDFHYLEPTLLSYRIRADGLLGLECMCGMSDTRLSDKEWKKNSKNWPKGIKHHGSDKAKFGHKDSDFKYNIKRGDILERK